MATAAALLIKYPTLNPKPQHIYHNPLAARLQAAWRPSSALRRPSRQFFPPATTSRMPLTVPDPNTSP